MKALLNAQIAKSLGIDLGHTQLSSRSAVVQPSSDEMPKQKVPEKNMVEHEGKNGNESEGDDDLGEYEFRLFSTAGAPSKVTLEDDATPQGDGSLVHKRPLSFYMVSNTPSGIKQQYQAAAVSGEDVLRQSERRAWGLELPWKVKTIRMTIASKGSGDSKTAIAKHGGPAMAQRKRLGKKRRIAVRTREKVKKEREEAATKKAVDKEEHIKEKKKRLNRLKKLRKRAKNKEAKQVGGEDGDDSGGESGDE